MLGVICYLSYSVVHISLFGLYLCNGTIHITDLWSTTRIAFTLLLSMLSLLLYAVDLAVNRILYLKKQTHYKE